MLQRRNLSYVRKVSFPPVNDFPTAWLIGVAVLGVTYVGDVSEFTSRNYKELVRQARSEAWGVSKVMGSLKQMNMAMIAHKGDPDDSFLNAAPTLIKNGVVRTAIVPSLLSDHPGIAKESAILLKRLLEQPRSGAYLEPDLQRTLMQSLKKHEAEPWVVLHLVSALKALIDKHPDTLDVQELVLLANSMASKYTHSMFTNKKGTIKSNSFNFSYEIKINGIKQKSEDVIVSPDAMNLLILTDIRVLCDSLSLHFPKTANDLIPAFMRFHEYENEGISDKYSENSFLDPGTFYLAIRILDALGPSHVQPETVSDQDWLHFVKLVPQMKEHQNSWTLRTIKFLDERPMLSEPLSWIYSSALFGFCWGGLRTLFALRNVEPPISSVSDVHGAYNPNYAAPNPAAWRRSMAFKYGGKAAIGSVTGILFLELSTVLSKYLWIENTKTQVTISAIKLTATMALWLVILRSMPYSLVPYLFGTNIDANSDLDELLDIF